MLFTGDSEQLKLQTRALSVLSDDWIPHKHILSLSTEIFSCQLYVLTKLRVKLDGKKQENAGNSSGEALEYKDISIIE